MTEAVLLSEGRLDFRPREAVLPDGPGPWRAVWSTQVPVMPGLSRLLEVNDAPVLVNAPRGIVGLEQSAPSGDRELADRTIRARAGLESDAVLFDPAGRLYRWHVGAAPEEVYECGVPWDYLEAMGLVRGRLLIRRARGPALLGGFLRKLGLGWVTEMIEPGSGVVWRHGGDLRDIVPAEDSLLAAGEDARRILRLDAARGTLEWEQTLSFRVSSVIGVVAGILWLTTSDGEIVGLGARTGAVESRVRPEGIAIPDGVVDSSGRLHLCTGTNYTILDLRVNGAVVTAGPLGAADEVPSLVFGRAAIPTADGRLIFRDRHGRIFEARAGSTRAPAVLWRSPVPLLDCRAAYGMLFLLDREGTLSAIAP